MRLTILFFIASLLSGCGYITSYTDQVVGSGVSKTERREVPAFTAINTSGAFEIAIVCQKDASLELEGDDNLLPLIKTEVRDNTLYITHEKSMKPQKDLRVKITVPNLEAINLSGASNIKVLEVKNAKLSIEASGASDINISGETKQFNAVMSGASKVNTEQLRAERVNVSLSGAGKANVYASEELNAEVSGAGSITYSGDPKIVKPKISGIGTIDKKGA